VSDIGDSVTFQAKASVLYFLSDAYLNSPRTEVMETLRSGGLLESWPLDRNQPDTADGLDRLKRFFTDWSPDQMSILEDDYTRLFVGVGKTLAPPYESVYLSEEHILFERETLEVREWYAKYGLRVPQLHVVPDDHIGYELFFVARLKERAASLLDCGETEAAADVIGDSQRFVEAHPHRWAGMLVNRIMEHARTDFYAAIGLLTRSVLEGMR